MEARLMSKDAIIVITGFLNNQAIFLCVKYMYVICLNTCTLFCSIDKTSVILFVSVTLIYANT